MLVFHAGRGTMPFPPATAPMSDSFGAGRATRRIGIMAGAVARAAGEVECFEQQMRAFPGRPHPGRPSRKRTVRIQQWWKPASPLSSDISGKADVGSGVGAGGLNACGRVESGMAAFE